MTVTIIITVNEEVGNEALVDICIYCSLFTPVMQMRVGIRLGKG